MNFVALSILPTALHPASDMLGKPRTALIIVCVLQSLSEYQFLVIMVM